MAGRLRRRSALDVCLNVLFGTWVVYFVATGYVIPEPLLRHASKPPVAEIQHPDPAPVPFPVLLTDQDS